MKLLLTSGGIKNREHHRCARRPRWASRSPSPRALIVPDRESTPSPTARHGAWGAVSGKAAIPVVPSVGWKSLGVLELTALTSIQDGELGPHAPRDRRPAASGAATSCICPTG